MELPYNPASASSIIAFANTLVGKSIMAEYPDEVGKLQISNNDKGHLGKMVEKLKWPKWSRNGHFLLQIATTQVLMETSIGTD